jgi:uncharacterized protein YqeY
MAIVKSRKEKLESYSKETLIRLLMLAESEIEIYENYLNEIKSTLKNTIKTISNMED